MNKIYFNIRLVNMCYVWRGKLPQCKIIPVDNGSLFETFYRFMIIFSISVCNLQTKSWIKHEYCNIILRECDRVLFFHVFAHHVIQRRNDFMSFNVIRILIIKSIQSDSFDQPILRRTFINWYYIAQSIIPVSILNWVSCNNPHQLFLLSRDQNNSTFQLLAKHDWWLLLHVARV